MDETVQSVSRHNELMKEREKITKEVMDEHLQNSVQKMKLEHLERVDRLTNCAYILCQAPSQTNTLHAITHN